MSVWKSFLLSGQTRVCQFVSGGMGFQKLLGGFHITYSIKKHSPRNNVFVLVGFDMPEMSIVQNQGDGCGAKWFLF